jgi:hypothetical protein
MRQRFNQVGSYPKLGSNPFTRFKSARSKPIELLSVVFLVFEAKPRDRYDGSRYFAHRENAVLGPQVIRAC